MSVEIKDLIAFFQGNDEILKKWDNATFLHEVSVLWRKSGVPVSKEEFSSGESIPAKKMVYKKTRNTLAQLFKMLGMPIGNGSSLLNNKRGRSAVQKFLVGIFRNWENTGFVFTYFDEERCEVLLDWLATKNLHRWRNQKTKINSPKPTEIFRIFGVMDVFTIQIKDGMFLTIHLKGNPFAEKLTNFTFKVTFATKKGYYGILSKNGEEGVFKFQLLLNNGEGTLKVATL